MGAGTKLLEWWKRQGCLTQLFVILMAIVIIIAIFDPESLDNAPETSWTAYDYAQEIVKNNLKSPASAVFPDYQESFVNELGKYEWRVETYVDAQNSFGAMLRTNFTIVVKHDRKNQKWSYSDFRFY